MDNKTPFIVGILALLIFGGLYFAYSSGYLFIVFDPYGGVEYDDWSIQSFDVQQIGSGPGQETGFRFSYTHPKWYGEGFFVQSTNQPVEYGRKPNPPQITDKLRMGANGVAHSWSDLETTYFFYGEDFKLNYRYDMSNYNSNAAYYIGKITIEYGECKFEKIMNKYGRETDTGVFEVITNPLDKSEIVVENNGQQICNVHITPTTKLKFKARAEGERGNVIFDINSIKHKKLYDCTLGEAGDGGQEVLLAESIDATTSKINLYEDSLNDLSYPVKSLCRDVQALSYGADGVTDIPNQFLYDKLIRGETCQKGTCWDDSVAAITVFYITDEAEVGMGTRCGLGQAYSTKYKKCMSIADIRADLPDEEEPNPPSSPSGVYTGKIEYIYEQEGENGAKTNELLFGTEAKLRIVPEFICEGDEGWQTWQNQGKAGCVKVKLYYRGQDYDITNKNELSLDYWDITISDETRCNVDLEGVNQDVDCNYKYALYLDLKDEYRTSIIKSVINENGKKLELSRSKTVPIKTSFNFYNGMKGYLVFKSYYKIIQQEEIDRIPVTYTDGMVTSVPLDTGLLGEVEVSVYPVIELNNQYLVDDRTAVGYYEIISPNADNANEIGDVTQAPEYNDVGGIQITDVPEQVKQWEFNPMYIIFGAIILAILIILIIHFNRK